jgi:hypothetical protein
MISNDDSFEAAGDTLATVCFGTVQCDIKETLVLLRLFEVF